jgi:hypothetical protein
MLSKLLPFLLCFENVSRRHSRHTHTHKNITDVNANLSILSRLWNIPLREGEKGVLELEKMMGIKQHYGAGMMRFSKGSLKSLSSSHSDLSGTWSLPCASPARPALYNPRNPSSFLCMQNMPLSSASLAPLLHSNPPRLDTWASATGNRGSPLSRLTGEVGNNRALLQYIVLLAMALQLPNLFEEIIEILELHIHSFPILIILGVLPGMFGRNKVERKPRCVGSPLVNIKDLLHASPISSSHTINQIESYYRNLQAHSEDSIEVSLSPLKVQSTNHHSPIDEWGHFTDFDECAQEEELVTTVFMTHSVCRTIMPPLQEADEDL